ncbi:enamine deaminase RidA [Rhizobium sp. Root1203]|uniref:RidA family protein n=1 Tax=Rhizobium sp. Root1203 TaxID=1736427 RepID=UPI000708E36A|nr:Rid family hydrolase [Rhizobium sp. Root1203]KQV25405.1 enamine deaminase RidA [Rhizobium sp. Root1203]
MFEKVETGIFASKAPLSGTVKAARIVRSAHIAKNPQTGELLTGNIEEQARQVFLNLQQAMKAAGGSLADVVQIQAYLIDKTDAHGFNRIYHEFFSTPYPVRATVVVDLLSANIRVEILATAVIQ